MQKSEWTLLGYYFEPWFGYWEVMLHPHWLSKIYCNLWFVSFSPSQSDFLRWYILNFILVSRAGQEMVWKKELPHMEMSQDFLILRRIWQLRLNLVPGLQMTKHVVVITRTPRGWRVQNLLRGNSPKLFTMSHISSCIYCYRMCCHPGRKSDAGSLIRLNHHCLNGIWDYGLMLGAYGYASETARKFLYSEIRWQISKALGSWQIFPTRSRVLN